MDCPICENEMKIKEPESRGMGNQAFFECPSCGTVVLCSGDRITQVWTGVVQEGGKQCHSAHIPTSTIA